MLVASRFHELRQVFISLDANWSADNQDCTNRFQQDRVNVLKMYADYSWSIDEDHYVIFEHLGQDSEEKEWADYRVDEGKGIMLWGKLTSEFNSIGGSSVCPHTCDL